MEEVSAAGSINICIQGSKTWCTPYRLQIDNFSSQQELEARNLPFFGNILTRKIDGRFGASGVAVFNFIRDLLVLNFVISLLMLATLGIPFVTEVILKDKYNDLVMGGWKAWTPNASDYMPPSSSFASLSASPTDSESCFYFKPTFDNNMVQDCSVFYFSKHNQDSPLTPPLVSEVLLGKGFVEYSPLFLGCYPAALHDSLYPWPSVHLTAVASVFAVSLVTVVTRVGQWLRYIAFVSGGLIFSKMIFCGYDFSLTDKRFIISKQSILRTEIRAALDEDEFQRSKSRRTPSELARLHIKRIVVNCVICLVVAVGCLVIVMVAKHSLALIGSINFSDPWLEDMAQFLLSFLDTLTVWLLGLVLPPLLSSLGSVEEYSSRVTLLLFILRNAAFRFISIGTLVVSQLSVSAHDASCRSDTPCWETALGKKLYAQVVWDFLMRMVRMLLLLFYRILTIPCALYNDAFLPTFDIAEKVLDALSLQTLCWLSVPVAPLVPVLVFASLLVMWLLEMAAALLASRPATRVIQVSRSSAMFMVVLTVAWVAAAAHAITVLVFLQPSLGCGPFRGLERACDAFTYSVCVMDGVWTWFR
ncbi:transmembrane channel-like protein 7 [Scylla paramamosain]|uniref:transmembrane channel-like protein 7 n=1 Tax=Scylla paramamosain TaxID=85552 RepID=UPI0030836E45